MAFCSVRRRIPASAISFWMAVSEYRPVAKSSKMRFDLWEIVRVRLNGAELRFVEISERGVAGKNAAADFLPDAAADVHGQVADILVGHAELDGDHEHVVGRQIRFLERADFLNDPALKQADDFSAVVKVAGEPVQLP